MDINYDGAALLNGKKRIGKKYNPNEPFWLNRSIERTERTLARDKAKLEALKIQQTINEIDYKLAGAYPPFKEPPNHGSKR